MVRRLVLLFLVVACGPRQAARGTRVGNHGAPHLIAPLSGVSVASRRPEVSFSAPAGAARASVEFCADRACAHVIETVAAIHGRARPTTALPPGVVFWRAIADGASDARELWIPHREGTTAGGALRVTDFDGDGRADAMLTGRSDHGFVIHLGGDDGFLATRTIAIPVPAGVTWFGWAWGFGDVDGDGWPELVVSVTRAGFKNAVLVFAGGPHGPSVTPTAEIDPPEDDDEPGWFGQEMVMAGDLDGDGTADLIVGANDMKTHITRLLVYYGGPRGLGGPTVELERSAAPVAVGDLDGDGYADVVVRQTNEDYSGAQLGVYRGGPHGISSQPDQLVDPPAGSTNVASGLFAAGDVNGDGRDDVLVWYPKGVALFLGAANGIAAAPATTFAMYAGTTPETDLGGDGLAGAIGAGDVDGDGYDDVLVVAHWWARCADCNFPYGQSGPKHAWLVRGGPGTLDVSSPRLFTGATENMYPSAFVGGVGDVTGDGIDDLIFSAGLETTLYRGGAGGVEASPTSRVTDPFKKR